MILIATGLQREARIMARPGVSVIAGGGDESRLEQALEAQAGRARAILSCGIAGALADGPKAGDWLVSEDGAFADGLAAHLPGAWRGRVYADGRMIGDTFEKRTLAARTGAIAVDMESHVAARVAARHGLPFAVARVVSDSVDESLPPAARVGMGSDGRMRTGAVLRSILRQPGQIPALIRTGIHAETAFRSLLRGYDALARIGFGLPDDGELPLDMA